MDLFERPAGKRAAAAATTVVEGTLERIVFSSASDFTVARLRVPGGEEPVTIVGNLLGLPAGARLRAEGSYEENPRFGRQFRVASLTELSPQTLDGIKRYLGAGLVKGIGPELAGRMVARFREKTLQILDEHPERIREVPGIGEARARAIQRRLARPARPARGHGLLAGLRRGPRLGPAHLQALWHGRGGPGARESLPSGLRRLGHRLPVRGSAGGLAGHRQGSGDPRRGGRAPRPGGSRRPRTRLPAPGAPGRGSEPRSSGSRPSWSEPAIDRLARQGEIAIEHDEAGAAVYEAGLLRAERDTALGLRRILHAAPRAAARRSRARGRGATRSRRGSRWRPGRPRPSGAPSSSPCW